MISKMVMKLGTPSRSKLCYNTRTCLSKDGVESKNPETGGYYFFVFLHARIAFRSTYAFCSGESGQVLSLSFSLPLHLTQKYTRGDYFVVRP